MAESALGFSFGVRAQTELKTLCIKGPSWVERPQVIPAAGPRRLRVALLTGCVQCVLAPSINEATVRLLARHGCEVVVARGAGCCGALTHHLGDEARDRARRNVAAFTRESEGDGLDAIVANASGCGTMLKDYGHLLADDPAVAADAARVAGLARDVSEVLERLGFAGRGSAAAPRPAPAVAYHAACSLQHGQKIDALPAALLEAAGFAVRAVPDGHFCCGSAGTYNLLQPALAGELGARKAAAIESTGAAIVAAGNIGCMVQIAAHTALPVVHTVELLDWATGGPRPHLAGVRLRRVTGPHASGARFVSLCAVIPWREYERLAACLLAWKAMGGSDAPRRILNPPTGST